MPSVLVRASFATTAGSRHRPLRKRSSWYEDPLSACKIIITVVSAVRTATPEYELGQWRFGWEAISRGRTGRVVGIEDVLARQI